ncbi:hypothetical protein NFI96_025934, partial [Prochilodus magdalenae]
MDSSIRTLAEGCFGKVYKEEYKGTWAAVKKVPMNMISKKQLDRECRIYYITSHDNVVKLLGDPWLKDDRWNIPLEFIFGEELETTIFKAWRSKIQLTPKVKATIINGMCEGLAYLHSKDIVHQDLKPDNIMVEHGSYRAVIIDMGLAKFFLNGITSAQNEGNRAYSAPEILLANGVRDKRSDVWAMGKIIADLIARARLEPIHIRQSLAGSSYCSIVLKMLESHPSERPSMNEVITEIRQAGVSAVPPWAGPGWMAQADSRFSGRFCPTPTHINYQTSVHSNSSPVHQPGAVIPTAHPAGSHNALVNPFSQMSIGVPPKGTITQHHHDAEQGQMNVRGICMRNGRIVRYDEGNCTCRCRYD